MTEREFAYSREDVASWEAIFNTNLPGSPRPADAVTAPDLISFQILAKRTGACIRMRISDGSERTLNVTPVVCQFILQGMMEAGLTCGWLLPNGDITLPPVRKP